MMRLKLLRFIYASLIDEEQNNHNRETLPMIGTSHVVSYQIYDI
jgi:hypothetical protein